LNAKFKFSLQKVLDYKEIVEKRKKEEVAEALSQLKMKKKILNDLIDEKEWTFIQMNALSNKGVPAGYLFEYSKYLESLNCFIGEQKTSLADVEKTVEERRGNLLEACRNKRIMDKLKNKYYDRFTYNLNRELEKEVEDSVAYNTFKV